MPHPHFLILNSNTTNNGHIYIVGDVHGEKSAFDAALERLKPQDTLIIAGDIIDRGESEVYVSSSAQVLDKIIELNGAESGTAPRVYAIQGNHEQDFLRVLDILRQAQNVRNTIYNKEFLLRFIINGGYWIFKHPNPDRSIIYNQRFTYLAYRTKEHKEESMRIVCAFIEELFESDNVNDYLIENIMTYDNYIRGLPFIIKIDEGDANSSWVAHSDLTLSDETLNRMIQQDEGLTDEQIKYITEARTSQFAQSDRNASSGIVYCGHNIVDNLYDKGYKSIKCPTTPVRTSTNHINLDVGAYFTRGLILINHTLKTAFTIGTRIEQKDRLYFGYVARTINKYFLQRNSQALTAINNAATVTLFKKHSSFEPDSIERQEDRQFKQLKIEPDGVPGSSRSESSL